MDLLLSLFQVPTLYIADQADQLTIPFNKQLGQYRGLWTPNEGIKIGANVADKKCFSRTLLFKMFGPFGSVWCRAALVEVGLSLP